METPTPTPQTPPLVGHTVKETITSIVIAFIMAFVFRGFVVEAFLIPTGSMAPTLLGSHMRFESPQSGYSWAVGPWWVKSDGMTPDQVQGNPNQPVIVHDPMTGYELQNDTVPIRWGDRIFVMKYLYSLFDPQRFDVVVFRNPREPTVNFIKRLIGLPGEMVALIDGDVFVRTPAKDEAAVANPWTLPGWKIATKPERAQRAMWQSMFTSEAGPSKEGEDANGVRWFVSPWVPVGTGETGSDWKAGEGGSFTYESRAAHNAQRAAAITRLVWNTRARPIVDSYAYNESPVRQTREFPVSDVRMSAVWIPKVEGERISAVLETRGHTFRIQVGGERDVSVAMGIGQGASVAFNEVGTQVKTWKPRVGENNALEFWFVDQSLQLWCDGMLIARGDYDWSPVERVRHALRATLDEVAAGNDYLVIESNYTRPELYFEFAGGPFTLHNVGLARDIHYQADVYRFRTDDDSGSIHPRAHAPALATHPSSTPRLTEDEFFVCGDNSPQSLDGRLWDAPHPWVAQFDANSGVVHRDLFIGKAFFVYFPAPYRKRFVPVPDFGRMRFIW